MSAVLGAMLGAPKDGVLSELTIDLEGKVMVRCKAGKSLESSASGEASCSNRSLNFQQVSEISAICLRGARWTD